MQTSIQPPLMTLDELFGDINLNVAQRLYEEWKKKPEGTLQKLLKKEIILDAMTQINHKTGQNNNPDYMAYVLEWAVTSIDHANKIDEGITIPVGEMIDVISNDFFLHSIQSGEQVTLADIKKDISNMDPMLIAAVHEGIINQSIKE